MKIENSIRRLSFLCRLPDIKIAWINPCTWSLNIGQKSEFSVKSVISKTWRKLEANCENNIAVAKISPTVMPRRKFMTSFL